MNYFALNPMKKAIYFSNSYLSCCSRRHFEDEKMIRVQGPGTLSLVRQLDPVLNKKNIPLFSSFSKQSDYCYSWVFVSFVGNNTLKKTRLDIFVAPWLLTWLSICSSAPMPFNILPFLSPFKRRFCFPVTYWWPWVPPLPCLAESV